MVVCHRIAELHEQLDQWRGPGKSLGFVPTMGALHAGHFKLLQEARSNNDFLISSIFVNPAQFNNPEDFTTYPRDVDEDLRQMETQQCDLVFVPSVEELYPGETAVTFGFGNYEKGLEGTHRPGHFNGVALVLSKFFNLIRPHQAYFGQKDLQQASIVAKLVEDLHFNVNIVVVPTHRENDGLAYSSRNRRLNAHQRQQAVNFYRALKSARKSLQRGVSITETKSQITQFINEQDEMKIEYFEVVNSNTLAPVEEIGGDQEISLCIAGYVGEVRLLDNIYLKEED